MPRPLLRLQLDFQPRKVLLLPFVFRQLHAWDTQRLGNGHHGRAPFLL